MRKLSSIAKAARKNILVMHNRARSAHIASALSIVDILAVLYFRIMKIDPKAPKADNRDRFILSKGHGASALYSVLALRGIMPESFLEGYCMDGGKLCGHTDNFSLPGIEAATGSLGHGLPIGCGMAFAAKRDGKKNRVFVLLGDGECNEGSVWEAAMFAAHHKLDNLTVIVDRNHLQGMGPTDKIMDMEPIKDKWNSFGWECRTVDGHDLTAIEKCLKKIPFSKERPGIVIARTRKGKGVSFMENRLEWHYRSPDTAQMHQALKEIDELI